MNEDRSNLNYGFHRRASETTFTKRTVVNTFDREAESFHLKCGDYISRLASVQNEVDDSQNSRSLRRASLPYLNRPEFLPTYETPRPQKKETIGQISSVGHISTNLSSSRFPPKSPEPSDHIKLTKWHLLYETWKTERRLLLQQNQRSSLVRDATTLPKRVSLYQIQGELGTGNFSHVRLGVHLLTKVRVAVKILDRSNLGDRTARILSREIDIMERLHHPNIIRLYEACEIHSRLFLFLEYAPLGELHTRILRHGKYSEHEARIFFRQIISALKHMHDRNIFHRDLKAENVFLTRARFVKLGDFGFSTMVSDPRSPLVTFCGSPPYASPELFVSDYYEGAGVDLWATGVLLYYLVTGILPFRADNVSRLRRLILRGRYVMPNFLSDSCSDLVAGLLTIQVKERWTLSDVLSCEWMEDVELTSSFPWYEMIPREFPASTFIVGSARNTSSTSTGHKQEKNEVEAEHVLLQMGIQTTELKKVRRYGPHHPLTGVYRIVHHDLHERFHRENLNEDDENVDYNDDNNDGIVPEESYDGTDTHLPSKVSHTTPVKKISHKTKVASSATHSFSNSRACRVL